MPPMRSLYCAVEKFPGCESVARKRVEFKPKLLGLCYDLSMPKKLKASHPQAVSAHYDRRIGRIVIHLSSGLEIAFSPHNAQGLENASPADLDPIEISPSGFDIHFPKLDADFYLPALLTGFLGSEKWMASRLGSTGGKSRSAAKTSAAKRNGRLGGRPRKEQRLEISGLVNR
jgi:Protein of unknown function (DUF2442)